MTSPFSKLFISLNANPDFSLLVLKMDVIAGYKTGGRITGDILIDGHPKDPVIWKKISGYAEQNDILNPYLSVIETLRFTGNCRLPRSVDKYEVINRILNLMSLNDWKDYVVGREIEGEGLPKHARKRLTIAIQLVIQPKILFLVSSTSHQIHVNLMFMRTRPDDFTYLTRRMNQQLDLVIMQQHSSLVP
jgi:hypothetical protein